MNCYSFLDVLDQLRQRRDQYYVVAEMGGCGVYYYFRTRAAALQLFQAESQRSPRAALIDPRGIVMAIK